MTSAAKQNAKKHRYGDTHKPRFLLSHRCTPDVVWLTLDAFRACIERPPTAARRLRLSPPNQQAASTPHWNAPHTTHAQRENRYSSDYLRALHRRASELFRRIVDRQPEDEGGDRRSVPERLGGYLYYTRRDDGKGFPVYVRRPVEGTVDDEQVVREGESGSSCAGEGGVVCFWVLL